MTKPSADNQSGQPLGLPLNNQLGPAVPDRVFFKPQAILPNIDFKGSTTGN